MSLDRKTLKRAVVALLDVIAVAHPLGHQPIKGRRYVVTAPGGTPLEVMFEQDEPSSANLWVPLAAAGTLVSSGETSLASALRTTMGKDGKPNYGRHSALEIMPQLGEADLVVFRLRGLQDAGRILDQLIAASAARVVI